MSEQVKSKVGAGGRNIIVEKYLGITDPAADQLATDAFNEVMKSFVAEVIQAPEPGVKSRLVIGVKNERFQSLAVDLLETGELLYKGARMIKADGSLHDLSVPTKPLRLNPLGLAEFGQPLAGKLIEGFAPLLMSLDEDKRDAKRDRLFNALKAIATKTARVRSLRTLKDFRAELDPDALKIMDRIGNHHVDLYNWLQGQSKDFDPQVAFRRKQACDLYPLMTMHFKTHNRSMTDEIDEGRPIRPVIAQYLGRVVGVGDAPLHVVDKLRNLNWQMVGRAAIDEPRTFFRAISACPPEWLPKDRAGWRAMMSIACSLSDAWKSGISRSAWPSLQYAGIMKQLGPDWQKNAKRLNRAGGFSGLLDMARAMNDACIGQGRAMRLVERNATELGDRVLANDMTMNHARRSIDSGILGCFTVSQAIDASIEWHDRSTATKAAIDLIRNNGQPDDFAWGKACEDFSVKSGLKLVMLGSEAELMAEGAKLDHCVGGYAEACISRSIILAVRGSTGRAVATAELVPSYENPHRMEVVQVQGRKNSHPGKQATEAVNEWIRAVANGTLAFDFDGLDQRRAICRNAYDRREREHADTPEQAADIWKIYQRFMPKSMRRYDNVDAWLEGPEMAPARTRIRDKLEDMRAEQLADRPAYDPKFWQQASDNLSAMAPAAQLPVRHRPQVEERIIC